MNPYKTQLRRPFSDAKDSGLGERRGEGGLCLDIPKLGEMINLKYHSRICLSVFLLPSPKKIPNATSVPFLLSCIPNCITLEDKPNPTYPPLSACLCHGSQASAERRPLRKWDWGSRPPLAMGLEM